MITTRKQQAITLPPQLEQPARMAAKRAGVVLERFVAQAVTNYILLAWGRELTDALFDQKPGSAQRLAASIRRGRALERTLGVEIAGIAKSTVRAARSIKRSARKEAQSPERGRARGVGPH